VIMIDSFRYDYLSEKNTPFLLNFNKALRMKPTLGYSSGLHPIIVSGTYPRTNGVWASYYFSSNSPYKWTKAIAPFTYIANRFNRRLYEKIRIVVKRMTKRISSSTHMRPRNIPLWLIGFFNHLEREFFEARALGNIPTFFDILRKHNIHFRYIGYRKEKTDLEVFKKAMNSLKKDFLFVYFFQLDGITHKYGVNSLQRKKHSKWLDKAVEKLVKKFIETHKEWNVFIFSDHGMCDITGVLNIKNALASIGVREFFDYIPFYDSTFARFWFLNKKASLTVESRLNRLKKGHVLSQEELKKYGLDFKKNDYGELIFITNPGILLIPNYYTGFHVDKSMHGYIPEDGSQHGIFLFKNSDSGKKISKNEIEIIDIFPTITDCFNNDAIKEEIMQFREGNSIFSE